MKDGVARDGSQPGRRLHCHVMRYVTVTFTMAVEALILLTPAQAQGLHEAEIKAFASTMAMARTVLENCPGIEPDDRYLEALRQRLHVVEADHDAFAAEGRAAAEALKRAIAEAPSRQAWCDTAIRLYGPDGTILPGVLRR